MKNISNHFLLLLTLLAGLLIGAALCLLLVEQSASGKAGDTHVGLQASVSSLPPVAKIAREARHSVVNLMADNTSHGSGFIVSGDGYILTSKHLIENTQQLLVIMENKTEYPARIITADSDVDLALLKIEAETPLSPLTLGDSDRLEVGEWVIAIGNPFGLGQTVTVGVISAQATSIQTGPGPYSDLIQTDASINPGNSGGPLINLHGKVIGINSAIAAGGQGIGFAIPVNRAAPMIRQIAKPGR